MSKPVAPTFWWLGSVEVVAQPESNIAPKLMSSHFFGDTFVIIIFTPRNLKGFEILKWSFDFSQSLFLKNLHLNQAFSFIQVINFKIYISLYKYERKEPAEKLATNQAHVFFLICSLGKHYRAYTYISNERLKVFQMICKWILNFVSQWKQMTEHDEGNQHPLYWF